MAKLKTKVFKTEDLKEYPNNPRANDKAVSAVTESVRSFGYVNPIIVNKDGVILAGDVYDKSIPTVEAVELLDRFLVALGERGQQVFLISGNPSKTVPTIFNFV